MALTLEVVGQKAAQMGGTARKVFENGGTIGRLRDNDWVLPDEYISGRHAKISFSNGAYLIEDTSTNGVFVNSPQNRMTKGQPYALRDGDTIYIDDYEVRVTIASGAASQGSDPYDLSSYGAARAAPLIPEDPLLQPVGSEAAPDDPLALLGIQDARSVSAGPSAASLASNSPLSDHYRPPTVPPPPAAAPRSATPASNWDIPEDYDPFAPEEPAPRVLAARPAPAAAPARPARPAPAAPAAAAPSRPAPAAPAAAPAAPRPAVPAPRAPSAQRIPAPAPMPPPAEPRAASPPAAAAPSSPFAAPASQPAPAREARPSTGGGGLDFEALLAAAGIESARVTPELSAQFGQILRVVVSGLMDVLRARERIKDEFRMRVTTFKQQDNNPLKFSANVEDALHNLLVKRNAAFLGPVEAFDDAFADLRNHQMAMLAGMRVAYESMLAEFEPERLQEEFDRHVKGASFLSGSAKSKYWELYRSKFHDMVKDADSSFRNLFGDEFAKAYEEQLAKLKALNRAERR